MVIRCVSEPPSAEVSALNAATLLSRGRCDPPVMVVNLTPCSGNAGDFSTVYLEAVHVYVEAVRVGPDWPDFANTV